MGHSQQAFTTLGVAVLTVSDTRTEENDTSGQYLAESVSESGHQVLDHQTVIDDVYQLRAVVSQWIARDDIDVIISTGGTGFTARDYTPEALTPLFDKQVEGFGELFRHISYQEIGTSTIQSRAFAGFANKTVIFCVPGSTGACRTGWEGIIKDQLNGEVRPCNFVMNLSPNAVCKTRG